MPPRLNHRKSTKGCLRCKSRKVKCDETRPECKKCVLHGVSCEYAPFQPHVLTPDEPWPSAKCISAQSIFPDASEALQYTGSDFMRTTDLVLMHHYVTETTRTMSCSEVPAVRKMWCNAVPQMAFEEHGLLHALLAITAAHRATLLPNESARLHRTHQIHIDLALRRHRMMVADINQNGTPVCEVLCLNAILISLYTLSLRSSRPEHPYKPPVQWIYLSRGIRTLMQHAYWRFFYSDTRIQPLLVVSTGMFPSKDQFKMSDVAPFAFLLKCHHEDGDLDPASLLAYRACTLRLNFAFEAVQRGVSEFSLRQWLTCLGAVVPERFIELLSEKKPRALVILAYHFALVHSAQNIWWLEGLPAQEVRGINDILPSKWKWAMVWPLRVTEGRKIEACELPTGVC